MSRAVIAAIWKPVFHEGEIVAFSVGHIHNTDVGGAVPGSFNVSALDHMAEGLRITPVRVYSKGQYLSDVAELIANNTRAPADIIVYDFEKLEILPPEVVHDLPGGE